MTYNNLLTAIRTLTPRYRVQLDIRPTGTVSDGSGNILHMTTGGWCCAHGTRVLMAWFYPDTTHLRIRTSLNDNYYIYPPNFLPLKTWTTLMIHHQQQQQQDNTHAQTVTVNGTKVWTRTNNNPLTFTDVKVYARSPWWYYAPQASIKNVVVDPDYGEYLSSTICECVKINVQYDMYCAILYVLSGQ